jgi:hypothetical protein
MNKIKKFFDSLDVTKRGYVVNKWLTNGAFILLIFYMAFIVHIDGFDVLTGNSYFIECPSDSWFVCVNPFYDPIDCNNIYCVNEFLIAGESIGVKPSIYARSFAWVALFVLGLTLGLNHLLYNFKIKKTKSLKN